MALLPFFDFCSKGFGLADDGFDGFVLEVWRVAGFTQDALYSSSHFFSTLVDSPPVGPCVFADGFDEELGYDWRRNFYSVKVENYFWGRSAGFMLR